MIKTDFIVIGSGIAGLTFALKVAKKMPDATVTIITKSDEGESNTKYAQGGIAVALNNGFDSTEQHIADTLKAGDGMCDRKVVEIVVKKEVNVCRKLSDGGSGLTKNLPVNLIWEWKAGIPPAE